MTEELSGGAVVSTTFKYQAMAAITLTNKAMTVFDVVKTAIVNIDAKSIVKPYYLSKQV
jgi:hypothetical protein